MSEEQPHIGDEESAALSEPAEPGEATEPVGEPEPLSDRASRELNALEAVLRKTRRQMRAPLLMEGFAWTAATAGAVVVTAQFAALMAGERGPEVLRLLLGVGLGATAIGGGLALIHWFRTQPSLDDVARRLQRVVPEFRSDLVAALEFGRKLTEGDADTGWSPELAHAHLRRTTRMVLGRVDGGGTLANLTEGRTLVPALVALGGCFVMFVAPLLVAGPQIEALWTASIESAVQDEEKPDQRPVVGDIDLAFSYPPYTGLQRRLEPFTSGQISTLVGTEVTLRTYPIIRADKVEIVIKTTDGERVVPMKADYDRLEASLLLTKSGSYSFRATMPGGEVVEDGIDRTIALTPDAVPTVTITSHAGEVEVSPDEVLEISFTVSDDYGVESVANAAAFGTEDPKRKTFDLPELSTTPSSLEQSFELDLREYSLQPKDTLTFWIEATDNNSLTGPGVGKATPIMLRVTSPEDRHQKLIAQEMEVLEALLVVLADLLENPVGERVPNSRGYYDQKVEVELPAEIAANRHSAIAAIQSNQSKVLAAMGTLVEAMKADPLMTTRDVTLFESLYKQLYQLDRDGAEVINSLAPQARARSLNSSALQKLANWAAEDEDALEKGLIRLDNLLATQKMDSAKRAAEQIRDLKDRLKELLEKYRDTQDPELKKAILREIQRLRQRMAELMQQMSSQIERLPAEHVNMEALEQAQLESDARKMADSMQQLEDLLEQGDIDGAMRALDEMTASLDQMSNEMNEQFEGAEPEGLREMDKALSELMDKTNDLEARQRALEQETRDAQDEDTRRQEERVKKMLEQKTSEIEQMTKRQREQLEQLAKRDLARHDQAAADSALERVQKIEEMLQNQDIEQALQEARSSREELRALQFSMNLSKQYQSEGTPRADAVNKSIGDLEQARPRAQRIEQALKEVMDQAKSARKSSQSPQMQQLEQEQQSIQRQAEQLQRDVDSAAERFPMLEQKLNPPLGSARDQMGQARDSLDAGKPQRSLDHQRGALDSLRELKQSMKDALQKQRQQGKGGGGRQRQKDKVAIPTEDGRTQQDFREDVMDGMKQERLQDYDSEIQRYYESLMK